MLDAIRVLEIWGSNPQTMEDADRVLMSLNIEPAQREAMLRGDTDALARILGGRVRMFSGVYAPDDSPEPDEDGPDLPPVAVPPVTGKARG